MRRGGRERRGICLGATALKSKGLHRQRVKAAVRQPMQEEIAVIRDLPTERLCASVRLQCLPVCSTAACAQAYCTGECCTSQEYTTYVHKVLGSKHLQIIPGGYQVLPGGI